MKSRSARWRGQYGPPLIFEKRPVGIGHYKTKLNSQPCIRIVKIGFGRVALVMVIQFIVLGMLMMTFGSTRYSGTFRAPHYDALRVPIYRHNHDRHSCTSIALLILYTQPKKKVTLKEGSPFSGPAFCNTLEHPKIHHYQKHGSNQLLSNVLITTDDKAACDS